VQEEKKGKQDLTPVLEANMHKILKNASEKSVRKKSIIEFACLFIILFGSIFIVHGIFHLQIMVIIPPAIVCWVSLFYLYKRKAVQMISMAEQFVREDMVKEAYQVNVMLVVGVLIYGLRQTEFESIIAKGLTYMQAHYSLINPLFILPLIVLALGFLGLGPLTVMVLVAGIVSGME